MAEIPELLRLEPVGEARYRVQQPAGSQEGLDVVFGGQLIAQMIMAAHANSDGSKYVKSIHTIFSRAGIPSRSSCRWIRFTPVGLGPAT
ncbi:MAG: hypothetical protein JWO63_1043 [Frankiales bacterium]|nr:hypothetical protein [Frankiales bacterium]